MVGGNVPLKAELVEQTILRYPSLAHHRPILRRSPQATESRARRRDQEFFNTIGAKQTWLDASDRVCQMGALAIGGLAILSRLPIDRATEIPPSLPKTLICVASPFVSHQFTVVVSSR